MNIERKCFMKIHNTKLRNDFIMRERMGNGMGEGLMKISRELEYDRDCLKMLCNEMGFGKSWKTICKKLKEIKANARMIGHSEKKNDRNEANMNKWMKLEECIEFSANLAARVGETRDWDNFWEMWGFLEGD